MRKKLKRGISRKGDTSRADLDLAATLQEIEAQARDESSWPLRARAMNRAGDLCAAAGERDLAKRYYGRAIDAYLEAARFDQAAAMCRKLIRYAPDVVRARCTLAFIAVGRGSPAEAAREIGDYVRATREAGLQKYAIPRLVLLAGATTDPAMRTEIGHALVELGAIEAGRRIIEHPTPDPATVHPPDQEEEWRRLLRAAVIGPQDLWTRYWMPIRIPPECALDDAAGPDEPSMEPEGAPPDDRDDMSGGVIWVP